MFELLSGVISGLNQVGVLAAALVCGALGALLVGHALYWRLHAVRVQGEVIGVRQAGNILTAVYRYTLPSGQACQGSSVEGSDRTAGKQTGTVVPLWVIPERPDEVQEARHHLFTLVGLGLLVLCGVLFYYAVTAFRVGPATWIVGGLVLAHILERLRRIVYPADKRLPLSAWRQMLAAGKAARLAATPVQPLEQPPGMPAREVQEVRQRATLAGIGLVALGVHQGRVLLRLQASGVRTAGVVSALSASSGSGGSVTFMRRASAPTRARTRPCTTSTRKSRCCTHRARASRSSTTAPATGCGPGFPTCWVCS